MSLTLYPALSITTNNKCRIRSVVAHQKKIEFVALARSSSIATPSLTKLDVTSSNSQLNQRGAKYVNKATATAVAAPITESDTMSELERMRNGSFWLRKWNMTDLGHLSLTVSKHALALCAPFVFNWGAFWVTVILSLTTGVGVTLGYHRLLSHHSFKIPKWLEYYFVYCGNFAGQRDPIYWVSVHKNHHKYTDKERDPHSPKEGFWFSHIGWFHYNDYLALKCGESRTGEYSNVPELKAQWFYRFLHDTYVWHIVGLGALLYMLGGFPFVAWGMGMRGVLVNHFTFFVGSLNHARGDRPWNTPDSSTNSWLVAMLSFGEGWHNNHHAFPSSARHGLEWWQFDLTWEVIKFLEFIGLATDVKLPTEADKKRMMLYSVA